MKYITITQQITSTLISTLKIKILLIISTILFLANDINAQATGLLGSYVIVQNPINEILLYEVDLSDFTLDVIGNTNKTDIESISIHPFNSTIYTVSNGELGVLNIYNGSFSSIGFIGTANGELGQITIDNVYGIACSYAEEAIYVTHRVSNTSHYLLLKIDNKTGSVIPNSFKDSNNNNTDYTMIEKFEFSQNSETKITDIAIQPNTNELAVLHTTNNQSDFQSKSELTINNIQNGVIESFLYTNTDLAEGFSFGSDEYKLFLTIKAKYSIPNGDLVSNIFFDDMYSSAYFNGSIIGFNVKDIDFARGLCAQNLTIKENFTTESPIYPLQRSSNLISTETTTSPNVDVYIDEGDVEFKSNHITLNPGFEVTSDSGFSALIDPCE